MANSYYEMMEAATTGAGTERATIQASELLAVLTRAVLKYGTKKNREAVADYVKSVTMLTFSVLGVVALSFVAAFAIGVIGLAAARELIIAITSTFRKKNGKSVS